MTPTLGANGSRISSFWLRINNPRSKRVTEQSTQWTSSIFSLDPDALGDLVQSKDVQSFHSLGRVKGLEEGLRTDVHSGLSLDETYLGAPVDVAPSTTSTAPTEKTAISGSPISTDLGYDAFVDRRKFFGTIAYP
ncbi:unnamed protein product [Penicillium nalgiovense]|nr:unnamed protein product [Penicillium nalgiovense]